MLLLAAVALSALFAGVLFPGDPLDMVAQPLLGPGRTPPSSWAAIRSAATWPRGWRTARACRWRWSAAAAGISLGIGVLVGAAAGYFGGWLDDVLVRLTELVQTIPTFLLVIVIVAIGQPSARMIVLAIGAASWPVIARLVRAEFRAARGRVRAGRAQPGASATPGSSSARSCPMPCRRWW